MEDQNLGTLEQGVRMVLGGLAALSGIVLLVPGKASLASGALGSMLAIAGLHLFVTGPTGYCPIYRRVGRDTRHVQGKRDGAPANRWRSHHGSGERRQPWPMLLGCLLMTAIAWIVPKYGARDTS